MMADTSTSDSSPTPPAESSTKMPNAGSSVQDTARHDGERPPKMDSIPSKSRHEWYQNDNHVIISIFVKNVTPERLTIEFNPKALSVSIRLTDHDHAAAGNAEYSLELDLAHEIEQSLSSFEILRTKVEIKLQKKTVGLKWGVLEGDDLSLPTAMVANDSAKPAYPSSSKSGPKNWDQLEKEAMNDDFDKPEGEKALNALFQQIYKDASEDTRRAMMKSYIESNGTCLSTNWDEVKKQKVETKPPDGLELKKFEL